MAALETLARDRLRRPLAALAATVLVLLSLSQVVRGVDGVEVLATILFLGVFIAVLFGDLLGGVVGGAAAALAYGIARLPAVDVIGGSETFKLISTRGAGFLAFGVLGGLAYRSLRVAEGSAGQLVDEETGAENARSMVQLLDHEIARSNRYKNVFSVTVLDIEDTQFAALKPKERAKALDELGALIKAAVRTTDRVAVVHRGGKRRVIALLVETPRLGADVFAARFGERVADLMFTLGVAVPRDVADAFTYPDSAEEIRKIRNDLAQAAGVALAFDAPRRP